MDKKTLRRHMLALRRALPPEQAKAKSVAVTKRLLDLPEVCNADTILSYVSSKDNEVDTREFIRALLQDHRRVLVPVMQPAQQLRWSHLESLNELQPNRFGIFEPLPDDYRFSTAPESSVCIVPGIAFSIDGHRIGYGGGYFDRYLSENSDICSIGLAFEVQTTAVWVPELHDVQVKAVLTETAYYKCKHIQRD